MHIIHPTIVVRHRRHWIIVQLIWFMPINYQRMYGHDQWKIHRVCINHVKANGLTIRNYDTHWNWIHRMYPMVVLFIQEYKQNGKMIQQYHRRSPNIDNEKNFPSFLVQWPSRTFSFWICRTKQISFDLGMWKRWIPWKWASNYISLQRQTFIRQRKFF